MAGTTRVSGADVTQIGYIDLGTPTWLVAERARAVDGRLVAEDTTCTPVIGGRPTDQLLVPRPETSDRAAVTASNPG